MIENAVENHSYPVFMKLSAYRCEILISTEPAVQLTVIPCIVAVCIRLEHRRKIDCVAAQTLYMRYPVSYLIYSAFGNSVVFKRRSAESQRIYLIKYAFICPHFFNIPLNFNFFIKNRINGSDYY